MKARRKYRNRAEVEVAVLDALVDRSEEGMTVFELRASVDADIDELERALSRLKEDGLITVSPADERMLIKPDDRVVPDTEMEDEGPTLFDRVRKRFGF